MSYIHKSTNQKLTEMVGGSQSGILGIDSRVTNPDGVVSAPSKTILYTPNGAWFKATGDGNTGWEHLSFTKEMWLIGGSF